MKKKHTMKKQIQIRTNSKSFGDTFGVFDFNAPIFEYSKNEAGEKIKTEVGKGKFVKQTEFSHGTIEMEISEARAMVAKMSANCKNGTWVRLYEMN